MKKLSLPLPRRSVTSITKVVDRMAKRLDTLAQAKLAESSAISTQITTLLDKQDAAKAEAKKAAAVRAKLVDLLS